MQKKGENLCQLADYLTEKRGLILANWKARVLGDPNLGATENLSRREFLDHVPQVLDLFDRELRRTRGGGQLFQESQAEANNFEIHGLSRWQQGFSFTELVRDWNHLRCAILQSITEGVAASPQEIGASFHDAVNLLADLIAEGINQSVAKYEEIRQAEARSHAIDLRNTIHDLRQIASRQTELYQDASHDLAGHLGILSSITSVFQNRSNNQELAQLYEPLSEGLGMAMDILEDVKLQATLESGQTKLFTESLDLVDLMRHTLAPYLMLAKENGIDLEIVGTKTLTIKTDDAKLTRIVQNLMHNALKFTEEGSIRVEWGHCECESHCFVRIENSRVPSPAPAALPLGMQMVQASFTPLSRTRQARPSSRSEARTGASRATQQFVPPSHPTRTDPLALSREGLGLSIAKRLANLLNGRLDIEKNDSNRGVSATLILPIECVPTEQRTRPQSA